MKKEFICKQCGKSFLAYERKSKKNPPQFCSAICSSEASKKRIIKDCLVCGQKFEVKIGAEKRKPRKFCSWKCAGKNKRIDLPEEKIIQLYTEGKSSFEIAAMLGVSGTVIQDRLKSNNIKMRTPIEHNKGKNNPMYGKTHSPEARKKIREANKRQFSNPENREKHALLTIKQIKEGRTGKSYNKLETKMSQLLDLLKIEYEPQFQVKTYLFDFYLSKYNILIECDGTFWHADPRKYPDKNKLSKIQKRNIANDKLKNKVAEDLNFNLIRFWEEDIMQTPDVILKTLKDICT